MATLATRTLQVLMIYNGLLYGVFATESKVVALQPKQVPIGRSILPLACLLMNRDNVIQCADHCLRNTNCSSVNFKKTTGQCYEYAEIGSQLISSSKALDYVLVDMDQYKLIKTNDPCRDKPCKEGQQCLPNTGSYLCQDIEYDCIDTLVTSYFTALEATGSSGATGSILKQIALISYPGWEPATSDTEQFLEVQFFRTNLVQGISTKGRGDKDAWVKSYKVMYSLDCLHFDFILERNGTHKIFPGNVDRNTKHTVFFGALYRAVCVRIQPWTFTVTIGLRIEIYGCCNRWKDGIRVMHCSN